jgi:cation diffusion facilitator CzcD-associated flavoprotein CzcO
MSTCDVVIIGAGPYGLAAAAHLSRISGLEVRIFGEPMSFWESNMPVGMLLRSNWTATRIAGPEGSLTLEDYQAESQDRFSTPVPMEGFVRYGRWYQGKAVPGLDRRNIARVEPAGGGFRVTPETGEPFRAKRVVVAAGIRPFMSRPALFSGLPPALASHTSEHRDLGVFRGKTVLVVGSGQSALESAALLHESGAAVEVIGRSRRIHWLQGTLSRTLHHRLGRFTRGLLYAPTDVGPAGISLLVARPNLFKKMPRRMQDQLRRRCVRPAGARWLVERLKEIPVRLGRQVVDAREARGQVWLRLSDGTERTVDHVLMGTGFRPDISKYEFLAPAIVQRIRQTHGYPHLRNGLESTVPGLHFLGAPAAWSYGPLMQFVSGTSFASRALTRCLAGGSPGRRAGERATP